MVAAAIVVNLAAQVAGIGNSRSSAEEIVMATVFETGGERR